MLKHLYIALGVILMAGCSAAGSTRAPVEDRTGNSNYGNTIIEPSDGSPSGTAVAKPYIAPPAPKSSTQAGGPYQQIPSNAAVKSLVSIADNSIKKGDYTAASAALERALRHDAKNADLWHRLAQVRLRQSEHAQAESLALKSNALANGNKPLMSRNWSLISKSRRLRSDRVGADEAEVRAYQLSR